MIALLLALQAVVPPPAGDEPVADEIVVTSSRTCDLAVAGRAIGRRQLDALAAEWRAGRPVRVVVPAALRTRCLAKVMFRLQDRGVTAAEFVDATAG